MKFVSTANANVKLPVEKAMHEYKQKINAIKNTDARKQEHWATSTYTSKHLHKVAKILQSYLKIALSM